MRWFIENGPEGDIVLSSRVRLARNLAEFPFAPRLNAEGKKKILEKCKEASKPLSLSYMEADSIPKINRQMLAERRLISPEMLQNTVGRAVLISEDESISIMLNEEDHVRIQCMSAGFDLDKAYSEADRVDACLEETLDFGFSSKYGYATCCPTNTGTGMRASCMLHLPALTIGGYIPSLEKLVAKLGMTIRGIYGEGTKGEGCIYQISNQLTLGISEPDTIKRLKEVVKTVAERERQAREALYKEHGIRLEDKISRAVGTLKSAKLLTSEEARELLSDVRLGINLKITDALTLDKVNELMIFTGAAHIAEKCEENTPEERDKKRAEYVREAFN